MTEPSAARPTDPALALRWLVRARRGSLVVQALLMALAEAGTELHVHSPALLAALAVWIAVDLVQTAWTRTREPPSWLVLAHGCVDLAVLTWVLALSGGPRNPLVAAYLVYLALLAVVVPAPRAWAVAFAAMGLQALVVLHPGHLPGLEAEPLPPGHLVSHIVAFDLAAIAITWVVNRLSVTLREREAAELEAHRQRAITERLAALGTLAAGVTHELGTPLATLQLLVEEARREPPDAARTAAMLDQIERSRSILERLRGGDAAGAMDCEADVGAWVAEWRRAAPEVAVEVRGEIPPARIVGSEGSWRGALWVALDNARRAGARHVELEARDEGATLALCVRDDGVGLDPESAARAGEPFRTGWGGTGLGLFVARTFARSVGGDLALAPGSGGGAVATISMPRVAP